MNPFLRSDPSIHYYLNTRHAGTWDVRRTSYDKMTLEEMNELYVMFEEQNDSEDEEMDTGTWCYEGSLLSD